MSRLPRRSARAATATPVKAKGKTWKVIAVIVTTLIVGGVLARWSAFAIAFALFAVVVLSVVVFAGKPLPLIGKLPRASGFTALGLAALLAMGGGLGGGSTERAEETPVMAPVAFAGSTQTSASPQPSASPNATSKPRPTPTPTPTTFATLTEDAPVPFANATVEDPEMDQGATALVTAGIAGTKRITYRATLVGGVEVSREVTGEVIIVEPVNEVTAIGTRVPQPVPFAQPASECDPNYSGACVPIASDVDCEGGGGNGPAYVSGPVYVVGSDIYKLDRDGDGVACD
ncbi:G5 domain-containing protein [Microbacterium keratanolyticum]|uniref:G5 domain-containing protein n=1 Tax=Microbacterium keratanolyticum TaxID=67574 RepID=UPI003637E8C6